jgi:hypothetical protein
MAAVTVANRVDSYVGDRRAIYADVSSVDDADTMVTGLNSIDQVLFVPQTAVAVGATVSGGTITFKVAAGTLAGKLLVLGL